MRTIWRVPRSHAQLIPLFTALHHSVFLSLALVCVHFLLSCPQWTHMVLMGFTDTRTGRGLMSKVRCRLSVLELSDWLTSLCGARSSVSVFSTALTETFLNLWFKVNTRVVAMIVTRLGTDNATSWDTSWDTGWDTGCSLMFSFISSPGIWWCFEDPFLMISSSVSQLSWGTPGFFSGGSQVPPDLMVVWQEPRSSVHRTNSPGVSWSQGLTLVQRRTTCSYLVSILKVKNSIRGKGFINMNKLANTPPSGGYLTTGSAEKSTVIKTWR